MKKRIICIAISLVMLISALPVTVAAQDSSAWLFVYFTGNSQSAQRIRFAVSQDGYNFCALNNNDAVIVQNLGTKCCRDPYIFRGQDNYYYLIATDMDASTNQWWGNSNTMVIWRSADLVNWTDETVINMSGITSAPDIQRCWAPQVIWNEAEQKYMVYFALASGSITENATVMYYCLTDDLLSQSHYSYPQLLYAPSDGGAAIDGDIIRDSKNGIYYLYYKDETNATICYVTSNTLTGPYSDASNPTKVIDSGVGLEGCNSHFITGTDTLVMLADAYGDGYFVALTSTDFKHFTQLEQNKYSVNALTPRHGSVVQISKGEYDRLVSKYGKADRIDIKYTLQNEFAKTSDWAYDIYSDECGKDMAITTQSTSSVKEGVLDLRKSSALISDNAIHDILYRGSWTVSFKHTLKNSFMQTSKAFALADAEKDYIVLYESGRFFVNGTEIGRTQIVTATEYDFKLTYDGTAVTLYKDGEKEFSVNARLDFPPLGKVGYIGLGYSDAGNPQRTIASYSDIRIRSFALTEKQAYNEFHNLPDEPEEPEEPEPVTPTPVKVNPTKILKLTAGVKRFTVKWKKIGGVNGYQLQYSTSKKFTKKTTGKMLIGSAAVKKTVKKLKAKKIYYVRIRCVKKVNNKNKYSAWSAVKTVKTK